MNQRHKVQTKMIPVVFGMTILLMSILFRPHDAVGAERPGEIPFFLEEIIAKNARSIGTSRQLIFVTNTDASSSIVMIHFLERDHGAWKLTLSGIGGTIGEKGFAPLGRKREGDGKSPTGIFPLGTAFGYAPSVKTRMPYRQATEDDFWVDDPNAKDYNKWVRGKPKAASYEKMKREDDLYKYGIVIEYNTNPIVQGKGSAIFLHLWRGEGKPTLGCVAMPEDKILKVLGWLDPNKKPMIVMGTEGELSSMGPP